MRENDNSGFYIILGLIGLAATLTAYIHDAINSKFGWLILEIALFPIAFFRGLYIWFS